MQRWTPYLALVLTAILLAAGRIFFPATEGSASVAIPAETHTLLRVCDDDPTTNLTVRDRCSWYLAPASGTSTTLGRIHTPSPQANGIRCHWLTGFRRVLSSPLFLPSDTRLAYARQESSARAFARRRQGAGMTLFGPVAATVTRPADGYLYTLGCMVI